VNIGYSFEYKDEYIFIVSYVNIRGGRISNTEGSVPRRRGRVLRAYMVGYIKGPVYERQRLEMLSLTKMFLLLTELLQQSAIVGSTENGAPTIRLYRDRSAVRQIVEGVGSERLWPLPLLL